MLNVCFFFMILLTYTISGVHLPSVIIIQESKLRATLSVSQFANFPAIDILTELFHHYKNISDNVHQIKGKHLVGFQLMSVDQRPREQNLWQTTFE